MNPSLGVAGLVSNITRSRSRLSDREAAHRRSRSSASDMDETRAIGMLQAENAELRLYLASLISIMISKKYITQEEFEEITSIIDGMDGVVDGRFDGEIARDGTVEAGAKAEEDLALRQLASIVNKKEEDTE